MINTAVIFAAGKGTRMRPFTEHTPKALAPINAQETLLSWRIKQCLLAGIERLIINTAYLAPQIHDVINAYKSEVEVILSYEKIALETGGTIKSLLPILGEDAFFIINNDMVWESGYQLLLDMKEKYNNTAFLLAATALENTNGYEGNGDFNIDTNGRILFNTKQSPYIYCGIGIMQPYCLSEIKGSVFSLSKMFRTNACNAFVMHEKWTHIDTVTKLKKLN